MKRFLPQWELRNIKVFYVMTIFSNSWFMLANWMFLYEKYISKSQIGFIDGFAILMGIFLEVPTGLISDVFGKKRTLLMGNLLLGIGYICTGLSTQFDRFLLSTILVFIGFALNSGSFEAFAYDSLVDQKKENDYDKVVSLSTSLGLFASFVTIFAGGLLFAVDPRWPLFASGIGSLLCVPVMLLGHEPRVDSEHTNTQGYLKKLNDGVKTIFSFRFQDILIPILVIGSLAKLHQGVVRQSMAAHFTFNGETFGYALAFAMLPALFVTRRFHVIRRKLGTIPFMNVVLFGYASIFGLGLFATGKGAGLFYFIIIMMGERLAYQVMSVSANERIESAHRATALSTLALITQIPYVLLMFFFANITEENNLHFMLYGFICIALIGGIYSVFHKHPAAKSLPATK